MARCGSCRFGGADLAELVRRVSLSVRGTACTSCAAAADSSEGRGWCAGGVGDYQIAPIAVLCTAMGRWRLTPPWYGDAACGRDRRRNTPHPSACGCHLPLKGKALGDGGRSEKCLPWLKQAAASASAPVNAGTVLLTDSDDRCTPPASAYRQICMTHSAPRDP